MGMCDFVQVAAQFFEGEGAVAEGVLYGLAKLGEGFCSAIGDEEGVVAKTTGARRVEGDAAGADGLEEKRRGLGGGRGLMGGMGRRGLRGGG